MTIDMEKWILKPCRVFQESMFLLKMPKGITMAQMELVMKAAGFKEVK